MIFKKTNRRHREHKNWKYLFEFSDDEPFNEMRVWCWDNFGPSREAQTFHPATPHLLTAAEMRKRGLSPRWAWQWDQFAGRTKIRRIYINKDKDASFMNLKWGKSATKA